LTAEAFDNAITLLAAIGGGTNAVLICSRSPAASVCR
jgi:dihydroxyacid dehydratase/phosphogluconate dehydratase